jgi:hypothetical protein
MLTTEYPDNRHGQFNLIMQQTRSSIAGVIPSLKIIISKWKRFSLTGVYKDLCMKLVKTFEAKFKYELNSSVYQVASLLHTNKLKTWFDRDDCQDIQLSAFSNIHVVFNTYNTNKTESTELAIIPREATADEGLDFYLDDASYRKINGQSGVNVELGMEHILIVTIVDRKFKKNAEIAQSSSTNVQHSIIVCIYRTTL